MDPTPKKLQDQINHLYTIIREGQQQVTALQTQVNQLQRQLQGQVDRCQLRHASVQHSILPLTSAVSRPPL